MPPFLAQGMCSGIRDSHNLAWKLDLVLSDKADDALLDTYQTEREPHVRLITEKAIELGRVQTMRDPVWPRARSTAARRRKANQGPDKLRYPGLTGGLIAGNGEFFPQGVVGAEARDCSTISSARVGASSPNPACSARSLAFAPGSLECVRRANCCCRRVEDGCRRA